jgi:hypothetical protein
MKSSALNTSDSEKNTVKDMNIGMEHTPGTSMMLRWSNYWLTKLISRWNRAPRIANAESGNKSQSTDCFRAKFRKVEFFSKHTETL